MNITLTELTRITGEWLANYEYKLYGYDEFDSFVEAVVEELKGYETLEDISDKALRIAINAADLTKDSRCWERLHS